MSSVDSSSWLSPRGGVILGSALIGLTLARQLFLDSEFPAGLGYYTPAMQVALQSPVKPVGKTYVVTGANVGLGRETTRVLYSQGAQVILACRSPEKAKAAKEMIENSTENPLDGSLICESLDLSDLESVRKFAQKISNEYDTLDSLVCNAGVMNISEFTLTKQSFESQWGINHVAHYYLIRLLTPMLQKSPNSRVIVLSSMAQMMSPNMDEWLSKMEAMKGDSLKECTGPQKSDYNPRVNYGFAKASNLLCAKEYHRRYSQPSKGQAEYSSVRAVSLHPGVIFTELSRHSGSVGRMIRQVLSPLLMKTVESGSATTIYCTLMEYSRLDGCFWSDCSMAEHRLLSQLKDPEGELAKRLWVVTEQLIESRGFSLTL